MMTSDDKKTKKQLISELAALRRKAAAPEPSGAREKSRPDMADRFQRLFDTIGDAVFIFDADRQTLVDVNVGAEKLYGYSRAEFFRKTLADLSAEPELSLRFLKELPLNRQAFVPLRYHRRKDGSRFPAEIRAGRYAADGRNLFYAVVHDITERQRIEDALRVSEATARLLLQIPSTVIMLLDRNACFIEVNDTMTKRFHRSREKMVGMCLWDILPSHVAELRKGYFAQALSTGAMVRWEDERQGMWNDNSFIPVAGERGRIEQVIGFAVDITAGKMAEQKLRESEQRYRTLVESIPEAIVTADAGGKIVSFNPGAEAVYGYAAREIIGKDFTLLMPAKLKKHYRQIFLERNLGKGLHAPKKPAIGLGRRRDGTVFTGEQTFTVYRTEDQYFSTAVVRDITERKKTEERLHESEQLFRLTFEHAPAGIALFSSRGLLLNLNAAFTGILGYSAAELKAQPLDRHLHPEDTDGGITAFLEAPEKLHGNAAQEKRYIARDGRTVYVKEYIRGIFNTENELVFAVLLIEDITARKQVEILNANIISKMRGVYNELRDFSSMLPPDRRFSRLKTVQDFNLSPMENRVIAMLYNGDSNKQIAAQLHLSENTVKHHITSIFSKCKVTSRAHLLSMLRKDQIML